MHFACLLHHTRIESGVVEDAKNKIVKGGSVFAGVHHEIGIAQVLKAKRVLSI